MHALFISNSEGSALKKTRAILDRYATRIGAHTWETPITQEALQEVQVALKRKAAKNMSVACYINDFTRGMKLAWVIGNRNDYDVHGRYAMETHQKPPYTPYYIKLAAKLARASGYCHDFGKVSLKFQSKLAPKTKNADESNVSQRDPVRHEWLSERLLSYMLNHGLSAESLESGFDSLNPMANREAANAMIAPPFLRLESCHDALKFCVVTHHKLLAPNAEQDTPPEVHGHGNHVDKERYADSTAPTQAQYQIKENASITSAFGKTEIFNHIERLVSELKEATPDDDPEYWQGLALIARAALILADHEVSSQENPDKKAIFHANSYKPAGRRNSALNQNLIWHLENVGETAGQYAALFSGYDLPGIQENDIDALSLGTDIARYKWQDTGVAFIREHSGKPSLIFNIANTGAGKTRANMKFVEAARDKRHPFRVTSAFNLRTLTLQTRDAYRDELGLSDEALACIVGDETTVKLHDTKWSSDDDEGWSGNRQTAKDEEFDVEFNIAWRGRIPDTVRKIVKNEKTAKLIAAPTLVCTMDQIIAAGEPGRQAIHAKALTRIVSSDLILDEVDSYDPKALIAVLRVVHTSAIFGRNLVVSSATLPPVLADALMTVWRQGLRIHAKLNRKPADDAIGNIFAIADRVEPALIRDKNEYQTFAHANAANADRITKRYDLENVFNQQDFLNKSLKCAHYLHSCNHSTHGDKKVSVGLIRVANIIQCMKVAGYLQEQAASDPDSAVFVTAYHSKEIIARRALKEKSLDLILKRKKEINGEQWWVNSDETRDLVESVNKPNLVFIVVATPVEEVGRDHDFDWAVIEPSSIGSIIQTAGRVNRHRRLDLSNSDFPNIIIFDKSYHHLSTEPSDKRKAYRKPGHRIQEDVKLITHQDGKEILPVSRLMPPSGVISTELIFSKKPCEFAAEDERGIEYVITGGLQAIGDNLSWMNDWMYKKYRLRDRNPQLSLRYDTEEKKLKELTFKVRNGDSEPIEIDLGGHVRENEIPENTFFSWSVKNAVHEIMHMNGGKKIQKDELTRISLERHELNNSCISIDWKGVVVACDK